MTINPGTLSRILRGELTPEEAARADRIGPPAEPERDDSAWRIHNRTSLRLLDVEERTFEKFRDRDLGTVAAAKRRLEAWTPAMQRGYILCGTVGTGKSHLTKALLIKWATPPHKLRSLFISVADLMDELRGSFDTSPGTPTLLSVMERFSTPAILVLDDLGAEKTTEWVQEKFRSLLDRRLALGLATFMTSNLSAEDLTRRYDARIIDRLREVADFVRLDGPSYRGRR